jgi:hypothetical protein
MKKELSLIIAGFSLLCICSCDKPLEQIKPEPSPCLSYLSSVKSVNDVFLTFLFYNPEDLTAPGQYENISISVIPLYPVDSFPKIITISFDTAGVLCPDNAVRKGSIICRLNSKWNHHPSKADITFNRFFIDDVQTEGLYSFQSEIKGDSLFFSYQVINGKTVLSNNDSVTFNLSCQIFPLASGDLRSLNPFAWYTSGIHEFSGKDFKNRPFSVTVGTPLFFDNNCHNGEITEGEIIVMPDETGDYTVSFGSGECDGKMIITFNGQTFPVSF